MNSATVPLLRDFSDRLSPMVVKELRHGLRTRVFTSLLIVFQVGMIVLTSTVLIGVPMEVVNSFFWSLSLLAILGVLPLRGFHALAGETQGGTLDMLRLTSISAFRIVWGKWLALFSQVLLLASSLLPYLVARYHFGGVEIALEAMALAAAVLASAVATAAFVSLSSQRSMVLRVFLAAGVLLMLIPATSFIFILILDSDGGELLREMLKLSVIELVGLLIGLLLLAVYAVFTLLALAASRIASISENHSTWKRKVHLGVVGLLVSLGGALVFHPSEFAAFWVLIPAFILTLFIGMDVMTEDMPQFPSVIRQEIRRGKVARFLGRLLYPGWASGVGFYTMLMLAVLSAFCMHAYEHHWLRPGYELLVLVCLAQVPFVPLALPLNKTNRLANWCSVQIILGIVGILFSLFKSLSVVGILTPLSGLMASQAYYSEREERLTIAVTIGCVWALVVIGLAVVEGYVYPHLESVAESLKEESNSASEEVVASTSSPDTPLPPP